ncbi:hypothetical protein JAAARDRAFT_188849 [Jaapia argillacea MUCL 33604]|uniref:Guanine nucleotide-binding protein-like 1 n=1 Tax=Jaapia argillacea MUCL 33604 TaxID=933084 RepID=A0A067QKV6_9AGAM|nr:hypothetical protein JAAARDRAFT_188849 [Jaapia argillacea MUCL 33604]
MPRRKPASAKQHKAELQLKRAIKRGDAPAPEPTKRPHRKPRRGPTGSTIGPDRSQSDLRAIESAKRLRSSFIKLSPQFLAETKVLAANVVLERPVPPEAAIFPDFRADDGGLKEDQLTCMRRPKWRYDMTKKEVEKNEEGLFAKWLQQMDDVVEGWRDPGDPDEGKDANPKDIPVAEELKMPRSPTVFERNLEVWRQLWRVTELSQILLILLDSRCPLIHFPKSLASYLSYYSSSNTPKSKAKKVILVLTKVDLSGPVRADAWQRYLIATYPEVKIVQVESYYADPTEGQPEGKRKVFKPCLPRTSRESLAQALRQVHGELLEPPEKVKGDEDKLKTWRPPVKREINWEAVLKDGPSSFNGPIPTQEASRADNRPEGTPEGNEGDEAEPEYLTVGLIGQPNVGKSSLLNALFGESRVRASKTPGKTKHFQTLFWTPEVRLVDCPGLVLPSLVPMEMQVLTGILPISLIPSIPSCILYIAKLLPLEQILKLPHPSLSSPPVEDKRTWRDGMKPTTPPNEKGLAWTAMDILTAYANQKGWVTAKAGRPDIMRAGNAILRALAEGKIRWAFWPPGTDGDDIERNAPPGAGIGLVDPRGAVEEEESEESTDSEEEKEAEIEAETGQKSARRVRWDTPGRLEIDTSEEEEEEEESRLGGIGRFGALVIDDEDGGHSSEEG